MIFEQASELSEIGAGLQLSANATHVLHHLGLGAALAEVGVRPGAYVFRLHDTGEEIHRFALSDDHEKLHGAPYYQVHRADVYTLLAAKVLELKGDAIRLNCRVVGFEESGDGVKLRLADGTIVQGDLLVGADGLKSVICQQINGNIPATYTGDAAWRITVPVERLPRSEEHTSELQSLTNLVCRLLLEKKKTQKTKDCVYSNLQRTQPISC